MSQEAVVAGRYARALFEVAKAKAKLEAVLADLGAVERTLAERRELFQKLRHPLISAGQKKAVLRSALGDLSPLAVKFLELLVEKKRIGILSEIMTAFRREVDKELGISRVGVTSAYPLSTDEERGLQSALAKKLGKKLSISYKTDRDILGGLVVRAGMRVWDGSLRSSLNKLKEEFTS